MSTENIFEVATRQKLRFDSPVGALSVEDLWSLHLQSATGKANLDQIAKDLHKQLKGKEEISFVSPSNVVNTTTQLKFDIVLHIIAVRTQERDKQVEARIRAEKKQTILEIINRKENEQLEGTSLDDLRRMAESL